MKDEEINVTFQSVSSEEALEFMLGARERTIKSMRDAGIPEEEQQKILELTDKYSDF